MTLVSYPSYLQARALVGSWKLAPIGELKATPFEQGPARARRRFTAMRYSVQFVSHFSRSDFNYFRAFFESTLNHGADQFYLGVATGAGTETCRVQFDPQSPYAVAEMAFDVSVSMNLIVFDLPVLSAAVLWALETYGTIFFDTFVPTIHEGVHTGLHDALASPYPWE